MVLQEWSPDLALNDITFRCSPFWIQVHNISLNRMNRENSYKFKNFIRTFIKIDEGLEDLRIKSYLRVQVSVDITKSLKSGVFIRNEDGTTRWLAFKYERLSDFCFNWESLDIPQAIVFQQLSQATVPLTLDMLMIRGCEQTIVKTFNLQRATHQS